jgi:hypothetical protein
VSNRDNGFRGQPLTRQAVGLKPAAIFKKEKDKKEQKRYKIKQ